MRKSGTTLLALLALAACGPRMAVYGSIDAGVVAVEQGAKQRAYAIQCSEDGRRAVYEIPWRDAADTLDIPPAKPDTRPAMAWPSAPPERLTDAEVMERIWQLWGAATQPTP